MERLGKRLQENAECVDNDRGEADKDTGASRDQDCRAVSSLEVPVEAASFVSNHKLPIA